MGENGKEQVRGGKVEGWLELVLTVAIALAAVGTAWAGFQSAKWSGLQANSYAKAGALSSEATRQTTTSGQHLVIDVVSFSEWAAALDRETGADPVRWPDSDYRPDMDRLSGILYSRFRPELKRAVDDWLATRPLKNLRAPSTPFVMAEYEQRSRVLRAQTLLAEAERSAAIARSANQRSDNYVLTIVLFALVLFFASVTKQSRGRSTKILFIVTATALIGALILLATYPVQL